MNRHDYGRAAEIARKHLAEPKVGDAWYYGTVPVFLILEVLTTKTMQGVWLTVALPAFRKRPDNNIYDFNANKWAVHPLRKLEQMVALGARVVPGTPNSSIVRDWRSGEVHQIARPIA